MLLAEKIMTLRKRAGWSQEELAAQLGVSRQSVSKWEGAQSVPDMQKVVQMSRLFGVTTDYLLKEELGEPEPAQSEPDAPLRCVTMEQAADYLSLRRAAAQAFSTGWNEESHEEKDFQIFRLHDYRGHSGDDAAAVLGEL